MPTYDFKCDNCSNVEEVRRRFEDRATPAKCSQCGSPMKRLFGKAPGIQFRGEGWTGAQKRG